MTTEDIDLEATKPIPNYPNYRAGRDGSIWSGPGQGSSGRWERMQPDPQDGYLNVRPYVNKKRQKLPVHRAVCLAFNGEPPEGKNQCRHLNGNKMDNRPENLSWGNGKDQADDRVRHGTINRGERAGRSKLTREYVDDLLRRRSDGQKINISAEAEKQGVTYQNIWKVLKGESWRHPSPGGRQSPSEDEQKMNSLDELLNLWSRLTKSEQQEFLSMVQRGWES